MILFRLILILVTDIDDVDLLSHIILIQIFLHLKEIDDLFEIVLFSDREIDDDRLLAETGLDLLNGVEEVGA